MAENSDGGDPAVDKGGGDPRGGAAEMTGVEAPRHGVSVRDLPRRNPTGNTEVGASGAKGGENTAQTANDDEVMADAVDGHAEAMDTTVNDGESSSGNRKRMLAHERRKTPPKKHAAKLDPKSHAAETNDMIDTVFNPELRVRLEQVAPEDRMVYYDELDKNKRIRTIAECAGIIALLKCPGKEGALVKENVKCGKVGNFRAHGKASLTSSQISNGKVSHRSFWCAKPRRNGSTIGMKGGRPGCGKFVSSYNLWNLAIERRDEIRDYLESHPLLSQTADYWERREPDIDAAAKMKLANELYDAETTPEPRLQRSYQTRQRRRMQAAASAAMHARAPTGTFDADKVADLKLELTGTQGGASQSKRAAVAQLKELKYKVQPPVQYNIIPKGESDNDEFPFPAPSPPTSGAGGLLGQDLKPNTQNVTITAEQNIWNDKSPTQQFGLYQEMKGVIETQAKTIANLLRRDKEREKEQAAERKKNATDMAIVKEQLAVIMERLTGVQNTPVVTPPQEIHDDTNEIEFPALPPLPSGRQVRPVPPVPITRESQRPLQQGEEPDWVTIAKRGRRVTRHEAGDAYIARIAAVKKKLETIRAKSARRTAKQRTLREYEVLYFRGRGRVQHWQMKKLIRELLHDKERGTPIPLVFVSYIGGSIMEVLVDKSIAAKALTIIRELGHSYIKNGIDPLSRLVRKPTANTSTNIALTNARKCKERVEIILRKFAGPEVIDFYTTQLERADAVIKEEEAKDAAVATPRSETPTIAPTGNDNIENETPKEAAPGAPAQVAPAAPDSRNLSPPADPTVQIPKGDVTTENSTVTTPSAAQHDDMEGVTTESPPNNPDGEEIAQ